MSWNEFTESIIYWILGLIGGLVRELNILGNGRKFNAIQLFGGAFASGLTGWVIYCLCRHFDIDAWLTAALCGAGGYVGTNGLDMIVKKITQKLNIEMGGGGDDAS